eukprot:TRINITY_DN50552_c0_g1_i1.p1 TRINITY_DN50552_c0_g1~~TRINITY_DN50552_c0_g1_i1.p1  ORF type:complete len:756 (+),score=252.22 TRINITY_DN50552_c0_g1_i1:76-2268(+)
MRRTALLAAALCGGAPAVQGQELCRSYPTNWLDMKAWQSAGRACRWQLGDGGRSVTQYVNSPHPGYFVSSDDTFIDVVLKGFIKVFKREGLGEDNDFVGLTLGHQYPLPGDQDNLDRADALLISWSGAAQRTGGDDFLSLQKLNGTIPRGLGRSQSIQCDAGGKCTTVSAMHGCGIEGACMWYRDSASKGSCDICPATTTPDSCCVIKNKADELGISTVNAAGSCNKARRGAGCFTMPPVGSNTGSRRSAGGWDIDTSYPFTLMFTAERLKLVIGRSVRVDISAAQMDSYCEAEYKEQAQQCKGAWRKGRVAWYNFSQQNVKYSDVQLFRLRRDSKGAVAPAPVAQGEAYPVKRAGGGSGAYAQLDVGADEGLLVNDYSPDVGLELQLLLAPTYESEPNQTAPLEVTLQHGSKLKVNADGSFTYKPDAAVGQGADKRVEYAKYAVRTGDGVSAAVTAAFVLEPGGAAQPFALQYTPEQHNEDWWSAISPGAVFGTIKATGACILISDWQLSGGAGRFRLEPWLDGAGAEVPGGGVRVVAGDASRIVQHETQVTSYSVTVTAYPIFGDAVREVVVIDVPARCEVLERCTCGAVGICQCRSGFAGAACDSCGEHFAPIAANANCTLCEDGWAPAADCRFQLDSPAVGSPEYKALTGAAGDGDADGGDDCPVFSVGGACIGWLVIVTIVLCVLLCCCAAYIYKTQGTHSASRGKRMRRYEADEAAIAAGIDGM